MAGRREQWAELSLNPANMGTVEVRLSLNEDGAGAHFFSPHAQVREALEAAMPRLREMLSQAGITLQDTSVRDQSLPRRDQPDSGPWTPRGDNGEDRTREAPPPLVRARASLGLVDFYA
jgi:flagellar hook-length control protein FliK